MILKRTLKIKAPPMHGADVRELQTLLTQKGFPAVADGIYGEVTADEVLKAKKKFTNYPKSMMTKQAGPTFSRLLTVYKPAPKPKPDGRKRFVAALKWAITNGGKIGYSESSIRLVATVWRKWRLPFKSDCSGIGIVLAKWSKNPSPSGSWLWGNTTSFLSNLEHIPLAEVLPGDPILFDNEHATYALESGKSGNPMLFSHGGPDGNPPHKIRLVDEMRYHAGAPVIPLRLKVNP